MKMAKASERDIDAAGLLMSLLHQIDRGDYPNLDEDAEVPDWFDVDDRNHLRAFYDAVMSTLEKAPGYPGRVIGGMCYVIMFEKNEIVDPDSDTLDLHPKIIRALQAADSVNSAATTTGAAQTAEQVRGVEPRKVWSNNDEDFNFDTLDDLLDGGEYKPGDTVWVGEVAEPGLNELIDAEDVVDQMADRAHDIVGEHAEGYPDVSEDDKRELDVLLSGWIARCCPPNFYRVENVKPYVLSADDFPNDTTPVEAYGIPTPTHSSEAGDAS